MNTKLLRLAVLTSVLCAWAISSMVVQAGGVLLKKGSQGEEVKAVQQKLKELGYLSSSAVTGYYGDATVQAVRKYQKAGGFSVDGVVGPGVWGILVGKSASKVSRGSDSRAEARGYDLSTIQGKLKELGFYNGKVDGISGSRTTNAIKSFQKAYGLKADGVVGSTTYDKLMSASVSSKQAAKAARATAKSTSRGDADRVEGMLDWGTAQNIFSTGSVATILDIGTGIEFNVKRTMGYNHADTEALTAEDTQKMKRAFGGSWTWDRRPIVVIVNGRKIAASMSGMPHAGLDSKPALVNVSGRSGGFGSGENLDTIKGNGMDGHFDIHFLNSRTHGTNKIDPDHQAAIKQAARYLQSH